MVRTDVAAGRRPSIVVVGSVVMDVKFFHSGEYRGAHESGNVWQVERHPGGVGRNVATDLARTGAHVCFAAISAAGADVRAVEDQLSALGVVLHPHRVPGGISTIELVLGADGHMAAAKASMPARAESSGLRSGAVGRSISAADGVAVETGLDEDLLRWVRRSARRNDVPVCGLPTRLRELPVDLAVLSRYDVAVMNRLEAARILGEPGADRGSAQRHARLLCGSRLRTVVVTCGADGAVLATRDRPEVLHLPAEDGRCLDDTGAGDALAATFFAHFVGTGDAPAALRRGMRAAAITLRCRKASCARLGALGAC